MSPRERVYQTEGIVLRRSDFGESDRLLTVFTPDRGKIKLVAKGARKPSSRKSGHVELFSRGQYLVAVGRDLDVLTQAETIEPYKALREDLLRTTYGYYVAELADAFTAEHDENRPLYELLKEALGWLSAVEDLPLAARYYELHLLGLVGYQPQLFFCVGCKRPVEPVVNYLSAADGGMFCPRCHHDRAGMVALAPVSVNALKVLRFLQTREWEDCHKLRLSPASHAEVEQLMSGYITYYLERKLKSADFIHRLRRQMGVG